MNLPRDMLRSPWIRRQFSSALTALVAAAFLLTAATATAGETSLPGFEKTATDFLQTHCTRCHDESKQKGKFRLDKLGTDFADPATAEKWSEVLFRINAAEMPPKEEPQPTAKELGGIAEVLARKISEGSAARMARRGPVQHYRLSRQEYAHTIHDLLGVVFDVEAPGALNEDTRWHGFDRIGAMLAVAPSHIERYFEAADAVVALAFPDQEVVSKVDRRIVGEGKRQLLQLGEGWTFSVKSPGRYRIRIRASGLPAFSGLPPRLSLWHTHHRRSFAGAYLTTPETEPATLEFAGLFPAGTYEVRNHGRTQRAVNGSIALFRNEKIDAAKPVASLTAGQRSPWTKVVDENGKPTMPLLLVDWVEVEGPLLTAEDRAKCDGVFPADENKPEEWRRGLRRFAERAWRRPVTESEIERFAALVAAEREAGESFHSAYRSALAAVLVSRRFLSLEEGDPDKNRPQIDGFELASRLSYLLWSSMPDERLFASARSGDLRSPDKLAQEFDRMIADPKAARFLDSFPKQWLQLHRVGMFQPDSKLYPDYDPWLEESMVLETTASFAELFRNDRPLREAFDSNWTMLNARLARHYGLPPSSSADLTRVTLKPESGRGGLLTHASILSLTSDGTRHRPVHRGAWLSEAILAFTPPPPPPNVDPLEPVPADKPKTTIRAQLQAHATSANCVSCHAKIDPLGLAFENFDAIGRWRETERVQGGTGDDPRVDASGVLPDGRTFANAAEFKKLIAADERRLAEAFVEQLATYALRRVMTVDDKDQLRAIVAASKEAHYGVRSLIRALVLSELFRKR